MGVALTPTAVGRYDLNDELGAAGGTFTAADWETLDDDERVEALTGFLFSALTPSHRLDNSCRW